MGEGQREKQCLQTSQGSRRSLWPGQQPPRGIKLSPPPQPRQELRPLGVARAPMEEGTKETPEAACAIRECCLVEVTAKLSKGSYQPGKGAWGGGFRWRGKNVPG